MKEVANVCLSDNLQLSSFTDEDSLEWYLWRYLFPPIFLIGIVGNLTELYVLFSLRMRNRASNLLSAMAFADVSFLLSILPHSLANYSTFALNYTFRFVYFHAKHELIALANWSSTVAIWLVLIVCVDRLLGIRSPLHSHKEWTARKTCLLLLGIVVGTGLLTSFHHVSHQCYYWSLCNGTQVHSKCFSVVGDTWRKNETNPTPQWVRNYVRTGTTLHALFGIIFPTIALIALNVALVRELKKRYNQPLLPSEEPFLCRSIYKPNDDCVQRRQERRVTVTVCAIVCCFILTQGPSSLLLLWNMFGNGFSKVTNPTLYDMSRAVNFLTAIGKSTNFFLFCFISASFRRRLTQLLVKKRRQSTVLSHFREFSSRRRKSSTRKSTKSGRQDEFSAEIPSKKIGALDFLRGYSAQTQKYCELNYNDGRKLPKKHSKPIQLTEMKLFKEQNYCMMNTDTLL